MRYTGAPTLCFSSSPSRSRASGWCLSLCVLRFAALRQVDIFLKERSAKAALICYALACVVEGLKWHSEPQGLQA
jgi:hypothetical protein